MSASHNDTTKDAQRIVRYPLAILLLLCLMARGAMGGELRFSVDLGLYAPLQPEGTPGITLRPSLHYFFDPYWRNTLATGLTWFQVSGETIWQIPLEDTIVLTLLPGRRVVPFLLTGPGLYDTLLPEENVLSLGLHAGGGVFLRVGRGGLSLRVRYLRYDVTDSDSGALEYGLALGARF